MSKTPRGGICNVSLKSNRVPLGEYVYTFEGPTDDVLTVTGLNRHPSILAAQRRGETLLLRLQDMSVIEARIGRIGEDTVQLHIVQT
jgi:hypothetical protein